MSQGVLKAIQKVIESNAQAWEEAQRALLAGQLAKLESANLQLNEQASVFRRLVHDARGSLGLVSGAAALLSVDQASAEHRDKFRDVLNRNLSSVEENLTEILRNSRINPLETTNKKS